MKTKKLIQLMSFMMFIVASVCVSSCKSDPEETTPPKQEVAPSIVGTWRWNFSDNGFIILTFNADGTGWHWEYDNGKLDENRNFRYVYKDNKLYYTFFSESRQKDITEIYDVISLTATTLQIKDFADEGISTFTRQNNSQTQETSASIVGTWVEFYEKETKWTLTNEEWVKTDEKEDNESGKTALYFGADGIYYIMALDYKNNWEKRYVSSYAIQGNILILSGSSSQNRTFSISGNVLEITETKLDGNQKEVETKRYRKM